MISNKLNYVLIFVLAGLIFSACDERWEEMNNDPGQLEELPDGYLFTSAVRGAFRDGLNDMQLNFGAQYAHISIADKFNREIDKYSATHARGDVYEGLFKSIYNGSIRLTNEVLQITSEGKFANPVRHAQATTIAVVNFAKLTDLYGDIPYFEAGMGKYGVLKPKYDRQEDIYADMVAKLKNCLDILKAASVSEAYPAEFDPLYGGDLDNWIRFTNSLRFRLAMRARFADPLKYEAIIAETLNEPLIEENNQSATLEHWDSNDGALYNPWFNKIIDYDKGNLNMLWSEKFINWLKSTNDPRLPLISTKNNNNEYLGVCRTFNNSESKKMGFSEPIIGF